MEETIWDRCGCIRCDELRRRERLREGHFMDVLGARMIVCPECGNKRCPKATFHENGCTGSNEPGQSGSVYTLPQFLAR